MPERLRSGKLWPGHATGLVFPQSGMGAIPVGMCYIRSMTKAKQPGPRAKKRSGFVIGRESFGKISAVEGIQLTPAMKKRAADAERKGLSPEEYRQSIARSYRKA
jgi:hypothetical protein